MSRIVLVSLCICVATQHILNFLAEMEHARKFWALLITFLRGKGAVASPQTMRILITISAVLIMSQVAFYLCEALMQVFSTGEV